MVGHPTHHNLRQIPARGRHPHALTRIAAGAALPRPWRPGTGQQRRRTRHAGARSERKNYLFVGSETGGKAAAIAYTLIETAKLNAVDPQAWRADTLARLPDYKITRVDDLLP
ncbi:MAG: transposase domain-containing protein [Rhodobacteraceae bacterium]|nr:transposase domain-containing protein [Paracoccaceae bacterium]